MNPRNPDNPTGLWSWEDDPDETLIRGYLALGKAGVPLQRPTIIQHGTNGRPYPLTRFCRAKCVAALRLGVATVRQRVVEVPADEPPELTRQNLALLRQETERVEIEWLRAKLAELRDGQPEELAELRDGEPEGT
jgi:hypothetical protein